MFRKLRFGFRPKFKLSFKPRIGTKLAIVSAFTVVLVAALIGGQVLTEKYVEDASVVAQRNQALMTNVLKVKTAIRGIQLGMNELRAAYTPADIEKAKAAFTEQQGVLDAQIAKALKFVAISYDRARLQKISGLVDVFFCAHADH